MVCCVRVVCVASGVCRELCVMVCGVLRVCGVCVVRCVCVRCCLCIFGVLCVGCGVILSFVKCLV